MRQDSLFFDRGGERGFARGASVFVTVTFLALVGYVIVRYKYFTYILREQLTTTPMFGWLLLAYVLFAVLAFFAIRRLNRAGLRSPWVWGAAIFLLALALRFFTFANIAYVPTSDFQNYYNMGVAFTRGDYAAIARISANYRIFSFSGLGVLNGLTMLAFGSGIRAFQFAQCLFSSLSCAVTYFIARRFDEESAPAAGLLFALYPANIVFSQVTSNQHLAVLFALLSIWVAISAFAQKKAAKSALLALLSGTLLLLSYYAHPSTATTLIAFCIVWLVRFFASLRNRSELLRLALVAAAFCAGFFVLRAGADAGMRAAGLSEPAAVNSSNLAKVVIGLNPETGGGYSASDWGMIWAQPASEQNAFCLRVIRERLNRPDLFGFFDAKLLRMWMVPDGSFGWATVGGNATEQTLTGVSDATLGDWLAGAKLLDFFYVAALFLFAWIGALLRKRGTAGDLLLWVFLGWIGVHFLIEIQTRYRYYGMPFLMIYAAYGVFRLAGGTGTALRRHKAKKPAPDSGPQ
jgi:hypothetical protein